MSHSKINKLTRTDATSNGALDCLTRYFSGCQEISSVFINLGVPKGSAEAAIAVLVKDAGMDSESLEALSSRYSREAQSCGMGLVNVEVLNISPAIQQYRVLREWKLLFERNRSFRTWFYEQAACDCQALAVAA